MSNEGKHSDECMINVNWTTVLGKKVMALRIIPLYSNLKEGEKFLDTTKSSGYRANVRK